MSLNKALVDASTLKAHVQAGCGAIANKHRPLIADALKQTVQDSLDLDTATRLQFPQDNRWDYILSIKNELTLVGIEPHSSRDDEISAVIAKKKKSSAYLRGHLKDGRFVAMWIWISSGKVKFSRMDPAIRRLDQNGIKFEGSVLRSFE